MAEGEHQAFDRAWSRTGFFYNEGEVESCRSFLELWENVKFHRLEELFPRGPVASLEMGCGSGGVSLYFHNRHGYRATLLDRSRQALAFAQENFARHDRESGKGAAFVQADVLELPFAEGSFDLVMSFGLLEHFADIEKPIAEGMRVLKPRGLFFADIVTRRLSVDSLSYLPYHLKKALTCVIKGRLGELRHLGEKDFFENSYSLAKYIGVVEKYGGRVELALGNRPVTAVGLPVMEGIFLSLYKTELTQKWWRKFDFSGSRFSQAFGAGWWILAVKD